MIVFLLALLLLLAGSDEVNAFDRFHGRGFGFVRSGVPASQYPALPQGETGIAAGYPGDVNIDQNANVLFAEDFEGYTTATELTSSGNWDSYFQGGNTTIDTGEAYTGSKSLRQRRPNSAGEVSNAIVKAISPDRDSIFVRGCYKFQAGWTEGSPQHNGIRVTANYPGPGTIPDGTDFSLINAENGIYLGGGEPQPGYDHLYIYHPQQNDAYGENWYFQGTTTNGDGPDGGFAAGTYTPAHYTPTLDTWHCREIMVQYNTGGAQNGRIAVWEDGVLVVDFRGVYNRDAVADDTVEIDEVQFENGQYDSPQINDKWWDSIVIATSYIGPVTALAPDTEDPTDPASLVATTASSSQINLEWTASTDNVGVSGYNIERCSGAACVNFAQVDTAPSNSYNDTGLSASTVYRYRVQAYDAAANTSGYSNVDEDTTSASGGAHFDGTTRVAASCSQADVNTQIAASSPGDIVLIPDGSCSWSTGVNFGQISVEAENYTPTDEGTLTRSVIITNNSNSDPLFDLTTGNSYHTQLAGIRINEGTGTNNHVETGGSGTKIAVIRDVTLEIGQRIGDANAITGVDWTAQGGLLWNTKWINDGSGGAGGSGVDGSSFLVNSPRLWETDGTIGDADTDGDVNVYLEDSSCFNIGQWPDLDDHGRFVSRYNNIDGCWGLTHGFTSLWGGRHTEYYNNVFSMTDVNRNIAGRYFWFRAGTGIFTENVVNNASNPQEYGNLVQFQIGDNTSPTGDTQERRPGTGYESNAHVIDPIYVWTQTGTRAYQWAYQQQPGGWEATVEAGIEVFVNTGPNDGEKPGYTKYQYPHPVRAVLQ